MSYFGWTPGEFEQVWNPYNCEIWLLERNEQGEYRLCGRLTNETEWVGAGMLAGIRFGVNQSEPLPEHMRQPAGTRVIEPGAVDALDSPLFTHLSHAMRVLPRGRGTTRDV